MIRYIKGTLEMIEEDAVVLDNHGIGYRILVVGGVDGQAGRALAVK